MDSLGLDPGDYLAGLWRGELVKGLLWYASGRLEPRRYTTYCGPSWSCASIQGGVKYLKQQYQFDFEAAVTILEAKCAASPLDPTGRVEAGYILLKGWIGPAELIVKEALLLNVL